MENKICILVQELLPLYAEGLCSPQSEALIRSHIEDCPDCRAALHRLQSDIPAEEELRQTDGPKEPFRRVKLYYLHRALAAVLLLLVVLAAAFLTLHSLGGDGVGWGSLFGWHIAGQAMEAVVEQDEKALARYVDFQNSWGPQNANELLRRLEELEEQGIRLVDAEPHLYPLDDGFVFCGVDLTAEYQEVQYRLEFRGQYTGGKAAFAYPVEIWRLNENGEVWIDPSDFDAMPQWMLQLCKALATYDPG